MKASRRIPPSAFEEDLAAFFRARENSDARHQAAFERFAETGFPNRRVEGWKWSDFAGALRSAAANTDSAAHDVIASSPFAALNPLEFLIIDGVPQKPAAVIDGLEYGIVDPMATIPDLESHAIVNLNVAMTERAVGLTLRDGVLLDRPILIRHIQTKPQPAFAKVLMRICDGASATLIETFEGIGAGFASLLAHVDLREDAQLQRYVVDQSDNAGVSHSMFAVKIDKDASFRQTSLSTGGRLVRHETLAHFCGDGATAHIDSVALLGGERHADFTTHVLHKAPGCKIRQLHKGVARDRGRAVFQGKFEVERDAQKTDAKMTANALLLTDGAEANHKPELEIYADDVECAHGSTVGALDDDALFYLRQRGLSEHQARALLIEAFAGEVIDAIEDDQLRSLFAGRVAAWLEEQQ